MPEPGITVVRHDPNWENIFEHLRARIWPSIAGLASTIEHVGSTSVPGLAAKPIIDMTIVACSPPDVATIIHRLAMLGYQHRGDLGVAGREAFFAPPRSYPHHLYACTADALPLRNHLTIRDQLRSNPLLAREYGELKRSLARDFSGDIDAYIDGKTPFLLQMLANSKQFTADELEVIRGVNTT